MTDREKVIKGLEVILEETADMFYRSIIQDALALLKAQKQKCRECGEATSKAIQELQAKLKVQEPRVMTLDEVLSATKYGARLFTECEKEYQWVRYGTALFFNQAIYRKNPSENECKIAFMFHSEGEAYVRQWHIFYRNYGKTWRCWTSRPDQATMEATLWE